jgi:hypothetical protein
MVERVHQLLDEPMHPKAIARRLGIGASTVRRIRKSRGLERMRGRKPR